MVKCKDCGFLTLVTTPNDELSIAPRKYRTSGVFAGITFYRHDPICFRDVPDPTAEYKAAEENLPSMQERRNAAFDVINLDRPCAKFKKLEPGCSAREHIEMILTEQSLKLQAELAEKEHKRAESVQTINLRMAWIGIIVAGVIAPIAGAYFANQVFPASSQNANVTKSITPALPALKPFDETQPDED